MGKGTGSEPGDCARPGSAASSWTLVAGHERIDVKGERQVSERRTEKMVLEELSDEARRFLKRVLEIERAKLHLTAYNATEDLLAAVKEIIP